MLLNYTIKIIPQLLARIALFSDCDKFAAYRNIIDCQIRDLSRRWLIVIYPARRLRKIYIGYCKVVDIIQVFDHSEVSYIDC